MSRRLRKSITAEDEGTPVEWYLRQRLAFTRAQIRSMKFRPEGITVNGERARVTRRLAEGDVLELLLEDEGSILRRGGKEIEAAGQSGVLDGGEKKPGAPGQSSVRADGSSDMDADESAGESTAGNVNGSGRENTALCTAEISRGRVVASGESIEVLFEDEDVIAVWKPAGMVVHPGHGHYSDSLANRLQGYLMRKEEEENPAARKEAETPFFSIRSIGRLDRDTSGIVVFGKNAVAAQRLWEQRKKGIFRKEYLALCRGIFPEEAQRTPQTINAPIGKKEGELNKMCVSERGKPAVTYYQVAKQWEDSALIRVTLETGRTHQIRVHMAHVGHPLAGDLLYDTQLETPCIRQEIDSVSKKEDGEKPASSSMLLCAWHTEFHQPFTGTPIQLSHFPSEKWKNILQ